MHILELAKLSQHQAAMVAAQRGALSLMERGFTRYPASWDSTALAAMDGDTCVGVILYKADEDDFTLSVNLAYVEPAYRQRPVLAGLLSHLRAKFKSTPYTAIGFTFHEANAEMAAIVDRAGAKVLSHYCRVDINRRAARLQGAPLPA